MAMATDIVSRVNVYVQLPRKLHVITVLSTNVRTTGIIFRRNGIVQTYNKCILLKNILNFTFMKLGGLSEGVNVNIQIGHSQSRVCSKVCKGSLPLKKVRNCQEFSLPWSNPPPDLGKIK